MIISIGRSQVPESGEPSPGFKPLFWIRSLLCRAFPASSVHQVNCESQLNKNYRQYGPVWHQQLFFPRFWRANRREQIVNKRQTIVVPGMNDFEHIRGFILLQEDQHSLIKYEKSGISGTASSTSCNCLRFLRIQFNQEIRQTDVLHLIEALARYNLGRVGFTRPVCTISVYGYILNESFLAGYVTGTMALIFRNSG